MHKKLSTEGVVLGKREVGESHIAVAVLTRDLGLVRARAQSARFCRSKLRYGLEPLTLGTFSFVEGRNGWRFVGVDVSSRPLAKTAAARAASGRICKLLLRLVQGEEVSAALFTTVEQGLSLMVDAHTKDMRASIECVLVLRILFHLGYLPKTPELAPFIETESLPVQLAAEAALRRSALIRAINESLQATGL